jgi:membrane protease subunit (stomatin/prohibitin family)
MLRDPEFGPMRLRAFGTYAMRVSDPGTFIKEIVGTDGHFTTDELTEQLRNMIVSRFADVVGESQIPALDLAANYDELGDFVTNRIQGEFSAYGLELTKLLVENISLPPAVEEALDKRTSMGVIGDLSKYTQFQAAEAMRDAAQQEGGLAGGGLGMGMGFAMANQMAQSMPTQGAAPAPGAAAPPPLPTAVTFHVAVHGQQAGPFDLPTLQQMAGKGELTRETLVWKQGMANWTPAGQVAELAGVFGQVPPPLPPQGSTTPPPPPTG